MATPNNMNQPTDAGIGHDNSGNMQTYDGWTFAYDAQNRLISATKGSANATFSYDAKNRQIARSINGLVTFSVWDDWELVEEYTTGNARTAAYLQGAHGPVKSLLNDSYYFYQDSLGSTSHIADATGHLLEYYKYDLYGKPTFWNSGGEIEASLWGVRDLFGGERWIKELVLYDLRNRYYSPALGRFLQPDPVGFKGDASNLYRYCGNDWANKTDPMGEDMQGSMAGAGVAILVLGGPENPAADLVATGIIIYGIYEAFRPERPITLQAPSKIIDVPGKPEFKGQPGTTQRGERQTRRYGPDGYPETDVDAKPGEKPHVHDWGRPSDGGPPTEKDRKSHGGRRDPKPGDPPPPRGEAKPEAKKEDAPSQDHPPADQNHDRSSG